MSVAVDTSRLRQHMASAATDRENQSAHASQTASAARTSVLHPGLSLRPFRQRLVMVRGASWRGRHPWWEVRCFRRYCNRKRGKTMVVFLGAAAGSQSSAPSFSDTHGLHNESPQQRYHPTLHTEIEDKLRNTYVSKQAQQSWNHPPTLSRR